MRIIARKTLKDYWAKHKIAEISLRGWFTVTRAAQWKDPTDVKADYKSASFLANNRVVFNIKGNKYRLITAVNYKLGIIYIRFIGTHAEYDKINADTI
jgi:mRNA interferase HigB